MIRKKSTHNAARRPALTPTVVPSMPSACTPHLIPFVRPLDYSLQGLTDQEGTPYVEIIDRNATRHIRLTDLLSSAAGRHLQANNIILTNAERNELQAKAAKLVAFPSRSLAKRSGWTADCYILPNGRVIAPPGSEPAVPLFEPTGSKCQPAGTLDDYKRGVAGLLKKATLPTFAVMLPFVSPLLHVTGDINNFGVEFVGSDRDKLDSLVRLATSVVSRADSTACDRYTLSGTMLPVELLNSIGQHADLPLIMADVDHYAANASPRARGAKFDELLMALANGTPTGKPGNPQPDPARFVFVMTTTEAVSSIIASLRPIANDRAAEHVFTVRVGGGAKRFASTARKVRSLTAAQYGTIMAHFLEALVKARSQDEAALRNRIVKWVAEFRTRVAPATSDLATDRAIEAFGLVYAAGRLAKAYGALPESLNCMKAAVTCYTANRATTAGQAPYLDRLKALAANPETMRVDPNDLQHEKDAELNKLPAILRADPRGNDELLLTSSAMSRAFPDKKLMLRDASLTGIIKRDEGRQTVKRALRLDKKTDRVFCFQLL